MDEETFLAKYNNQITETFEEQNEMVVDLNSLLEQQREKPLKDIASKIDLVEDEHPYKETGSLNSYSRYNEGWSDACDRCYDEIEKLFNKEPNTNKGIDLKKFSQKIDDALDNETDESLTKWLTDKRKNQPKAEQDISKKETTEKVEEKDMLNKDNSYPRRNWGLKL